MSRALYESFRSLNDRNEKKIEIWMMLFIDYYNLSKIILYFNFGQVRY